ncbi:hypothetical protein Clacol_001812 [Clathrus columnatus]|uniref:Uncharacterized protein n=1 Tax=Clathrus columnatus TaxID=1419009 RepID=A0AAV5A2X3_9AGAM|nr:hypothetical protein Clacol_001812 [Clathrus columnatus]
MSQTPESNGKILLPAFLKILTSTGLSMNNAMSTASKMQALYKTHNTPALLATLTDSRLSDLHISEKEQRRLILSAIKKAGFKTEPKDPAILAASARDLAESSSRHGSTKNQSPRKRKRVESGDINEFLPEPPKEEKGYGAFDFKEVLDEKALMTRAAVVNRAPVMTAWAAIVACRMGFKQEEALSIASVYTEMNAISKGVTLGIYEQRKNEGLEASEDSGQPYVDFMGRRQRIPLYKTEEDQWRALLKGDPIPPSTAYRYITNAFRQTTSHIVGAMRLVAESYEPQELNRIAFGLYADFRPEVDGWGKKAEIKCSTILTHKRHHSSLHDSSKLPTVNIGKTDDEAKNMSPAPFEESSKRPRIEVNHNE